MKLSEDPDGEVRNSALQCIGIFKGRLGEGAMSNYFKDMNPQKIGKVNESSKAVKPSKYDNKKPNSVAAPPPAQLKGGPVKKPIPAIRRIAKNKLRRINIYKI